MWKLLVVVVVAVGVCAAYVAPDDHGRYNNVQRQSLNAEGPRSKPKSLAALHAEQGAALRAQEIARRRGTRDVVSGSYSGAGAGAGTGGFQGNGYGAQDFGFSSNPFPFYPFHNQPQPYGPADVAAFFQYLQQMQQTFQENAINNRFSGLGDTGYSSQGAHVSGGSYGNGASAVASFGPQGGYGSAQLTPDLGNRFGGQSGEVPPPRGGGTIGVFTSSSSGSSNINGHQTSYKEATSSINDNGKITTFTVRDSPRQ